jgi:hypothetical protein
MTNLRQLQEQFQNYVHQHQGDIEQKIVNAPQISVHERVEIYRQGYYLRLIDILSREFSVLKTLLGEAAFEALCKDYIDSHPSTHFSVRTYGRHMVQYLSSLPTVTPLQIELAEFEWAFGKVIDGPDGPQITVEDMANMPPEAWGVLRLELHPSLRIVPLRLNTPQIWQAIFDNNPEKPVPEMEIAPAPVNWLLWRFNQQAHYYPANQNHMIMVQAVQANQNFPEICEALCETMEVEEVAQFAGSTLREWVSLGLISRLIQESDE